MIDFLMHLDCCTLTAVITGYVSWLCLFFSCVLCACVSDYVYLCVCVSVCLYVCQFRPSVLVSQGRLSLSQCLYICMSVCISVCICLTVCLFVCVFVCSDHLSSCVRLHVSGSSVSQSVSVCLCVSLYVCVYLSVCLCVCLFRPPIVVHQVPCLRVVCLPVSWLKSFRSMCRVPPSVPS